MSEETAGIGQFLIRKSAQNRCVREFIRDPETLRNKNFVLYIKKKINALRQARTDAHKGSMSDRPPIKKARIDTSKLQLNSKDKEFTEFGAQVISLLDQKRYKDDFIISSNTESEQDKHRAATQNNAALVVGGQQGISESYDERFKRILRENLPDQTIGKYYELYKRELLKDKVNALRNKSNDFDFIAQKILGKGISYKHEHIDPKNEEIIFEQICRTSNLNVGSLMQLSEKAIKYKKKQEELDELLEQKKQGKLTAMEMLEELIETEELNDEKRVIEMFKATKLEDQDPGGSVKNKYKMIAFKKKKELQNQLQQQFQEEQRNNFINALKNPETEPERFVRPKYSKFGGPQVKISVFRRLQLGLTAQSEQRKLLEKSAQAMSARSLAMSNSNTFVQQRPLTSRTSTTARYMSGQVSPRSASNLRFQSPATTGGSRASFINAFQQDSNAKEQQYLMRKKFSIAMLERHVKVLKNSKQELEAKRFNRVIANEKKRRDADDLLDNCVQFHLRPELHQEISVGLQQLDTNIDKDLKVAKEKGALLGGDEGGELDEKFIIFKKQRNFKRRLIDFMVGKVENKSDLVSRYTDKQKLKEFTKNLVYE